MIKRYLNSSKLGGFTLIELMIAISIIALLSGIVLAALSSGKNKGNDSKVQSILKSMISQSQLYTGPIAAVAATTTSPVGDATASRNLFTSSTVAENGLYRLANGLPIGTVVYYASNGTAPLAGGAWAFAASTSTGSYCVDYTSSFKTNSSGTMTAGTASTQWGNLAGLYTCN